MLSRILTVGLLAGFLAGLVTTGLQMVLTVPMIIEAEQYEGIDPATATPGHGAHQTETVSHEAHAAEDDDFERPLLTMITNILIGVGGGLIFAAAFSFRRQNVTWLTGLARRMNLKVSR